MALTDQVLQPDSLTSDASHTQLSLGLPWFRSLPWGAVANLTVTIDDRLFGPESLSVRPTSTSDWQPLSSLAASTVEWFVQDRQTIRIDAPTATGTHRVRAAFQLVMPNLFSAPGQPIAFPSIVEKDLSID